MKTEIISVAVRYLQF